MVKKKNTKTKTGDYEIGYGKPPKHTQFKKGKSGNPNGKSKRRKSIAELIAEEGEQIVTVTVDGHPVQLTKMQVAVKSVVANACKGDHKSFVLIMANQPSVETKAVSNLENFSWTEEHEELLRAARDEDNPII